MKTMCAVILLCPLVALGGDLTAWTNKLAAIYGGANQQAVMTVISDSWGAIGSNWTDTAWSHFQAKYGSAGPGWQPGSTNLSPSRLTRTLSGGTWNLSESSRDPINCFLQCIDSSLPAASWTATNSSFMVYYRLPFGGTMKIQTNGVDFATVTGETADPTTATYTLPTQLPYTMKFIGLTPYVNLYGVDFRSSDKGVRIENISTSGSSAADWNAQNVGGTSTNELATVLIGQNPTLVVILLGVNDLDQGLYSTFSQNLGQLAHNVHEFVPSASLAIVSPADVNISNGHTMADFAPLISNVASTNSAAYINAYDYFPSYAVGLGLGYYQDTKHLSDLGNRMLANLILGAIDYFPASTMTITATTVNATTVQ